MRNRNTIRLGGLLLSMLFLQACRAPQSDKQGLGSVAVADPLSIATPAPLTLPSSPVSWEWPREWSNSWVSLEEFGQRLGFEERATLASEQPPSFALRRKETHLSITIGNQFAEYDGLICFLGFAPKLVRGVPHIHSLDIFKTLHPLLLRDKGWLPPNPVVVIDPGHGGRDPGTISPLDQRMEKEYTLDWGRRVAKLLTARGWRVFLTRTNDVEVSLADRVLRAEQLNADLFLSLHFNSGGDNRERKGIETYCLTPAGMRSNLVRNEDDNFQVAWPNNKYDHQNMQFASALHRSLIEQTGAVDGGIRRARFMSVLRSQSRPAVLVEGGYLSNPEEARRISTPNYRQRLAEAVAKGLN